MNAPAAGRMLPSAKTTSRTPRKALKPARIANLKSAACVTWATTWGVLAAMGATMSKAALVLALLVLAGCSRISEDRAHSAFTWACDGATMRHTTTTQGDTAEFHATCKVSP